MSDSQKSPNSGGLSEEATGPVRLAAAGMEIGADVSRMAAPKPPTDKDGKVNFAYPYTMPSGLVGMMPPAYAMLNPQHMLAAHLLSIYDYQSRMRAVKSEEEATKAVWEAAEQQKKLREMEDQRMENEKLTMIKLKPPEQGSAVASDAVKKCLRSSLMRKQLQKNNQQHASSIEIGRSRAYWGNSQSTQSPRSTIPTLLSPSYRTAGSALYPGAQDIEFPIRKTLSEPNLKNKVRSKITDRLNSPQISKRKLPYSTSLSVDTTANGTGSNPGSPPVLVHGMGSTPAISKELRATKRSFEEAQAASSSQLSADNLYISMPNIPLSNSLNASSRGVLTKSDLQARAAARYGLPLTGHMMSSPFHPSVPGISEEEYFQNLSGFTAMHDARMMAHPYRNKGVGADPQAGQRHIRHPKPLSRTQSAPLPMLVPGALGALGILAPQQQTILEHQQLVKQHQDQFMKNQQKKFVVGQLRQTILQRSSSKSKMEHVDEETEARLIQEMQESREDSYESQALGVDKPLHSSHGSLYAAVNAASKTRLNADSAVPYDSHKQFGARYLARTHSSPLVFMPHTSTEAIDAPMNLATSKSAANDSHPTATGVTYDETMLRHHCPCQDNSLHLENPTRIRSIWNRLQSSGVVSRCRKIDSRKATIEQLQLCHTESYSLFFGVNSLNRKKLDLDEQFQRLACGGVGVDTDTVWNEDHSAHAARIATGSVIELASRVYERQLKNGMAVVRPPGHHAESGQAMGFCFFNSIAIAAKHLKHRLGASKILILDWDVHHGNGTQQMTYDDPSILYISLHRHDNGNFFPGTGDLADCGEKQGLGFNVNVAFNGGLSPPMGDAEYMAAFRSIVMPIVNEFKPQVTLVSAGFDGADGHAAPLGGYKLSPAGFGFMTKQLMSACEGRVVLVLEGGYNLPAICDASEMSMRALLGENVPLPNQEEIMRKPCEAAVRTLSDCAKIQSQFWPMLKNHVSKISISFVDSLRVEKEETEAVSAMASLSMVNPRNGILTNTSSTDSEPMEEV